MPRTRAISFRVGRVSGRRRGDWWQLRFSVAGKRLEEHVNTRSITRARERASEIDRIVVEGSADELASLRESKTITLAELVDEFMAKTTNWEDSTKKGTCGIRGAIVAEWGQLPVSEITTRMIDSYLSWRLDIPDKADGRISKATANRYRSFLSRLFGQAMRWGYLSRNPASGASRYQEVENPRKALSNEEMNRLLAELQGRARAFALLAIDTGMRRSELNNLRWADVDMDRGIITVRGRKNKTFSVLKMTSRVHELLVELRRAQRRSKLRSLYVLERNEEGKFIDHRRALSLAGERAGIGHVTPHMLRHTFATMALDAGAELYDVQAALGHKTPHMTMRYDHGRPERAQRVTEAIERMRQA